jgi:hypothetical protein
LQDGLGISYPSFHAVLTQLFGEGVLKFGECVHIDRNLYSEQSFAEKNVLNSPASDSVARVLGVGDRVRLLIRGKGRVLP